MKLWMKIILGVMLVGIIAANGKIREYLGFGSQEQYSDTEELSSDDPSYTSITSEIRDTTRAGDYFVNDSIYAWNDQIWEWFAVRDQHEINQWLIDSSLTLQAAGVPVEITWDGLEAIRYRLRYFKALDMEIFAPIFSDRIKSLHGRAVNIKGYVIPLDGEGELIALSANPYASCFFCGQASPASVISMYLKKEGKRYKTDEIVTFTGTLHLNQDNPDDYYYILKEAMEIN